MRALFDNNAADAAGWLPKVDARAKLALSVVAAIGSLVVSNIQGQLLLCGFSMHRVYYIGGQVRIENFVHIAESWFQG